MRLIKIIKSLFSKKKESKNEKKVNNIENKLNVNNQVKNTSNKDSDYVDNYTKEYNNKNNLDDVNINNNLSKKNEIIDNSNDNNYSNYLDQKTNLKLENTFQEIKTIDVQEKKHLITNVWDYVKIKENTQAEHIIKSLSSDKWITMDEIRHNIKLNFNVEYSNEKSLYPYLKTLTDINLIKVNNTGKKRTWKKNIIIIK